MPPLPYSLPVQQYFRCVDDAAQPAGYIGDWPAKGVVYAGTVKPSIHSGEPHIHLNGFHAEKPWGAFAAGRFELAAVVWLN